VSIISKLLEYDDLLKIKVARRWNAKMRSYLLPSPKPSKPPVYSATFQYSRNYQTFLCGREDRASPGLPADEFNNVIMKEVRDG